MIEAVLWIIWGAWMFEALCSAVNVSAFVRLMRRDDQRWGSVRLSEQKPVALILPVKGFEPGKSDRFLEALLNQDYPRYRFAENYQIIGPFWVVLNYDSREFMYGAENLNNVVAPGYYRQSRPGTVVIAYFISKILGPVLTWIENGLAATGRDFHPPLDRNLHQYVAFILINLTAVVMSFWLYLKSVSEKKTVSIAAAATAALLLLNNIGKAFLLLAKL